MNKIILTGRISFKTEKKTMKSENKENTILNFGVITPDGYYDKNNIWIEKPNKHTISAFGKTAINIIKYCNVGDQIIIEGKYISNEFINNDTGKKQIKHHVMLQKFEFAQKVKNISEGTTTSSNENNITDDDIINNF